MDRYCSTASFPIFLSVLTSLRYTLRVNELPLAKRFLVATEDKRVEKTFGFFSLVRATLFISLALSLAPFSSFEWACFMDSLLELSRRQLFHRYIDRSLYLLLSRASQERKRKWDIGINSECPVSTMSWNLTMNYFENDRRIIPFFYDGLT